MFVVKAFFKAVRVKRTRDFCIDVTVACLHWANQMNVCVRNMQCASNNVIWNEGNKSRTNSAHQIVLQLLWHGLLLCMDIMYSTGKIIRANYWKVVIINVITSSELKLTFTAAADFTWDFPIQWIYRDKQELDKRESEKGKRKIHGKRHWICYWKWANSMKNGKTGKMEAWVKMIANEEILYEKVNFSKFIILIIPFT